MPFERASGVLLHPTSLPGPCGVGDLGASAYQFVDFLEASGQRLWQILPLGPTGAANSPYQTLSSFAGNPLLIALEPLAEMGLLSTRELLPSPAFSETQVEFNRVRIFKEASLKTAYTRFCEGEAPQKFGKAFEKFIKTEAAWLDDFALFVALKEENEGAAWFQWKDTKLVARDASAIKKARKTLADAIRFHAFCQYLFFLQWDALIEYAHERKIELIGDLPIYVAHDSADVWAEPEFFKLEKSGAAKAVAGVPPDYFSTTGQLWGNPVYDWKALAEDNYDWWVRRIKATLRTVDRLRIDHFRAFEAYWEVPASEETAVNGEWIQGPGDAIFEAIETALGALPVIAEDLGTITPEVHALREGRGLPGMKVLHFGFCDGAEIYRPHTFEKNSVVYTATHDNDTTQGWYAAEGEDYAHMDPETLVRERDLARRYLARDGSDISWDLIRLALGSVADTAILLMQDLLNLGNDARMNRPGISEGQWMWRMTSAQLKTASLERLRELCELYDR